jgi:hypothetical protein
MGEMNMMDESQMVKIKLSVLDSMKRTFSIGDEQLEPFLATLIEKAIQEYISEENVKVLSQIETKELEEDLKGLGYI